MTKATEAPLCTCHGELCFPEGRTYQCEVCLRDVPWCFGAGDEFPDACDDCVAGFYEVIA